ncbi:MAG: hypothetical protein P3W93_006650 [Thermus sp.]|nr:hypothetical protein [Thermus sp.]
MSVERVAHLVGKVLSILAVVVILLSSFRLDGTGLGLGLILGLYGFGVILLGGIYGELKAIRAYLGYMAAKTAKVSSVDEEVTETR